jgi:choline monooxygenase
MTTTLPPFERELSKAHTLPSRMYTDPAIWALERRRIFARTWQPFGRVVQLHNNGDFVCGEIAGEPVVVVRDGERLRGYFNVCRHRAGAVADGCGNRRTLQCQYHGWTYGLDGALLNTPEFDGVEGFDKRDFGLVPVAVDTFGPWIFVNLDGKAPPLGDVLGNIRDALAPQNLERMQLCRQRDYTLACNWKVYVDNYLEGYHLPIAHPGLFKALDYRAYRTETSRWHSSQIAPVRPGQPGSGERVFYYWVFPNWMLNVYSDNVSINIIQPLAVDKTLTDFQWYALPESDGARRMDEIVAVSDEIQREDIILCESVQKRLGSMAYDRGRFSVRRENGVHHFQSLVHELLSDERD